MAYWLHPRSFIW